MRALVARDAAAFCVAGVAQPYIHLHFTWQAWHNPTSTFVSRGRHGTHGTPWRAWVWFGRALVARDAVAFCVRGTPWHSMALRGATYTHTYIHPFIHPSMHACMYTYIPTVLPSRSFTISFVFPSFPLPAKTIEAHYWKKLTCGVIRSFNFLDTLARQALGAADNASGCLRPSEVQKYVVAMIARGDGYGLGQLVLKPGFFTHVALLHRLLVQNFFLTKHDYELVF